MSNRTQSLRAISLFAVLAAATLAQPAHASVLITVDKSAQEMSVAVDGSTR